MKSLGWVLFHAVGITSIISLTAYLSIPEKDRNEINKKIKEIKKGETKLLELCNCNNKKES